MRVGTEREQRDDSLPLAHARCGSSADADLFDSTKRVLDQSLRGSHQRKIQKHIPPARGGFSQTTGPGNQFGGGVVTKESIAYRRP
jgi:hypothetical protein